MASWDSPAVAAPSTASYAAPIVDFSTIANLPRDYFGAKEMAYKSREMQRAEDQATAFRGGIPKNGAGDPDYSAMSQKMLQLGNYPEAITFQNTGISLQQQRNGQVAADRYFSPQSAPGVSSPASGPVSVPARPSRPVAADSPQGDQPGSIMSMIPDGVSPEDTGRIASTVANAFSLDPNAAPPADMVPRIRAMIANKTGIPINGAIGTPQSQPGTPSERVDQGFSDTGSGSPQASAPLPAKAQAMAQSKLDSLQPGERKGLLQLWATSPAFPKSLSEFAEKRLEAIERGEEPTTEIKNYNYDARTGGGLTAREANVAGAKAGAEAPFKIAAQAIREGARPVAVKPGEVVTTGGQLDPALAGITNWASHKMGVGTAGAPTAPAPPPNVPNPPPLAPDQPALSAFTPQLIRNPDGSVASNITPSTDTLQKTAAQNYEKAREAFSGAQEVQSQLTNMENGFRKLNASGWSSTGTGAEAKLQLAKAANSVWQTLGVKDQNLPFDPTTIGSWEALTKDTTRLGFALSRTLGAREAMQVVSQAINANPSIKNTPLGAKMVLNTIRQNAERQSDFFEYATRYAQSHAGDLLGAETSFAKLNPPAMYARRAIVQAQKDIPQEAVQQLRDDPKTAAAFDEHYGQKGLANMFLGNARLQGLQ